MDKYKTHIVASFAVLLISVVVLTVSIPLEPLEEKSVIVISGGTQSISELEEHESSERDVVYKYNSLSGQQQELLDTNQRTVNKNGITKVEGSSEVLAEGSPIVAQHNNKYYYLYETTVVEFPQPVDIILESILVILSVFTSILSGVTFTVYAPAYALSSIYNSMEIQDNSLQSVVSKLGVLDFVISLLFGSSIILLTSNVVLGFSTSVILAILGLIYISEIHHLALQSSSHKQIQDSI